MASSNALEKYSYETHLPLPDEVVHRVYSECDELTRSSETFAAQDYSILLIDDDPDQLRLFDHLLQTAGFRVFSTVSADHGLEMMKRLFFDVIVSDLRMPGMTGFEFVQRVRAIRTHPPGAHIPIVALTAMNDEFEFAALRVGADLFCEKKNAKQILVEQIKFLLEG